MIELNPNGAPQPGASAADVIRDATDQTFMTEVVEASQQVPVIVDFWAPWCGPCKQLTPALEKAVTEAGGTVRLVKVNVDESQQVAAQLRIQSIPTVYAFYQGQPIDGFQGALPASEIKTFVGRVAQQGGGAAAEPEDGGLAEAVAAAEEMLAQGAAADAVQTFAAVLGEEPDNAAAYGGLVRAHLAAGEVDRAAEILSVAPAGLDGAPELETARAQLDLAQQAQKAGPASDLRDRVEADPDDHQARYDLSLALQAEGDMEGAIDQLLESFRRDRDWNDGAAKAQLFKLFDSMKASDPRVQAGRRRLSSMIFA